MAIQIDSKHVAKELNKELRSFLRDLKVEHFQGRRACFVGQDAVLGFSTGAVGSYFAQGTGFRPFSFWARAWCVFKGVPAMLPNAFVAAETYRPNACHRDLSLTVTSFECQKQRQCKREVETERKDIWRLDPGGKKLGDVIQDVKTSITAQAVSWWNCMEYADQAICVIEKERDSTDKYFYM